MRAHPSLDHRCSGFTTIELLIAMVIAGALAAIAYPSFRGAVDRSRRADSIQRGALPARGERVDRERVRAAGQRRRRSAAGCRLPPSASRDERGAGRLCVGTGCDGGESDRPESALLESVMPSRSGRVVRTGRRPTQGRMQGVLLIELMIGITIGLLIAAGAVTFVAGHLNDNRRLLLESRLMQDLRTAADIVARDLRRAGYWAAAADGIALVGNGPVASNPYAALAPSAAASDSVSFGYSRDVTENGVVDSNEQFGFRLRNGALEIQLGATNWQALTDTSTLVVTAFRVTPTVQSVDLGDACAAACPIGSATCPPRLSVRSLAVEISGRALADAAVVRTVRSGVRLRADAMSGACSV